jgi:hypothetical protein
VPLQLSGDLPMQKKYLLEGFNRSTSPKHKTVFATNISEYYDRVNQVDSALIFFQALMRDSSFSNPYYDAVRLQILSRQTKTLAQINIIDKKATADEAGVRVELIIPFHTEHR